MSDRTDSTTEPNFGDWVGRAALYWPNRLAAVVDDGRGAGGRFTSRFTYAELDYRAERLAAYLQETGGIRQGDRVGLLAYNGVEYLDALFACSKLGAALVPFNWRLPARELEELLLQVGPGALIFSGEFTATIAEVSCPSVRSCLHLGDCGTAESVEYEAALAAATGPAIKPERVTEEDIICMLFTGGTTGLPKAAEVSHRMVAWNTLNTTVHELERTDTTITHTPMFHTGGLLVYTLPLLILGGTVVIMRNWDPARMLELIEAERVTMLFCVPAQYRQLHDSPGFAAADLSSLRFLTSGGAPLPVPLIRAWREVHEVPFKQGFGMTEFGPGIFSMEPEFAVSREGSIGRPNFFVEARLLDADDRPVDTGEVGELALRGPMVCSGYFNAEEAVDEEGWFRTGDLARRDADGFYYIVDRKKDMYISGGENVYPAEVERALAELPEVAQCAVVGVPDGRWGESGIAFVVPAAGMEPEGDDLRERLSERLARYKVPRRVEVVDELPISPAGKVLKRELRRSVVGGGPESSG